jgi:hypothetical protein
VFVYFVLSHSVIIHYCLISVSVLLFISLLSSVSFSLSHSVIYHYYLILVCVFLFKFLLSSVLSFSLSHSIIIHYCLISVSVLLYLSHYALFLSHCPIIILLFVHRLMTFLVLPLIFLSPSSCLNSPTLGNIKVCVDGVLTFSAHPNLFISLYYYLNAVSVLLLNSLLSPVSFHLFYSVIILLFVHRLMTFLVLPLCFPITIELLLFN